MRREESDRADGGFAGLPDLPNMAAHCSHSLDKRAHQVEGDGRTVRRIHWTPCQLLPGRRMTDAADILKIKMTSARAVRPPDSAAGIVAYRACAVIAFVDWLRQARIQAARIRMAAASFRLLSVLRMCYTTSDYRMILKKQSAYTSWLVDSLMSATSATGKFWACMRSAQSTAQYWRCWFFGYQQGFSGRQSRTRNTSQ
jgi:hypothetical protein